MCKTGCKIIAACFVADTFGRQQMIDEVIFGDDHKAIQEENETSQNIEICFLNSCIFSEDCRCLLISLFLNQTSY